MGRGKGPGLSTRNTPDRLERPTSSTSARAENRGAGSVMGIKLRRFCNGTRFAYQGY